VIHDVVEHTRSKYAIRRVVWHPFHYPDIDPARRDPWECSVVQRAFISFDYDNDARLKDLLVGQSKNPDSPFEVHDWSIKVASSTWREDARRRIRASGLVIVLCGRYAHLAAGIGIELSIAQAEQAPYFLLAGHQTGSTRPTTARPADKLYEWTWPNLKNLVGGAR
jgi:hypothetical protein